MDWVWHKIDVLIAAIFVAVAAVTASQGHVFMSQYQARLGHDLQAARAQVADIRTGLRYKLMSDVVRTDLENTAQTRLREVNTAHTAIAEAGTVTRPFAFIRHRDPALMTATGQNFVPALPRDGSAVFYAFIGALIGFAIYEILKFPLALLLREPRRRRFRRKG